MLLLLSFETQVGLVLLKPIVWAEVVAQLAERLLPTPEIRESNPILSFLSVKWTEKTKIKKKLTVIS